MSGRLSLFLAGAPTHPSDLAPFVPLLASDDLTGLWSGQALTVSTSSSAAYLAGKGYRFPMGLGVALTPFQHPINAALDVRSTAATSRQPVTACFGPGSPDVQRHLLGRAYRSPVAASGEYVRVVKQLLTGRPVSFAGRYVHCEAQLMPLHSPPIEVGLGVLRPAMARMAGREADVAITWMAPAHYIGDHLLPAMAEGRRSAAEPGSSSGDGSGDGPAEDTAGGRPPVRVVAALPFVIGHGADRDAQAVIGSGRHLRLPHYRQMLRLAGAELDDRDLAGAAAAACELGAILSGDPSEVAHQIGDLFARGVDEVALAPMAALLASGPDVAVAQLEAVLAAVREVPAARGVGARSGMEAAS